MKRIPRLPVPASPKAEAVRPNRDAPEAEEKPSSFEVTLDVACLQPGMSRPAELQAANADPE